MVPVPITQIFMMFDFICLICLVVVLLFIQALETTFTTYRHCGLAPQSPKREGFVSALG
jgi:hypothetical protein